jgi:Uma2 family endonuclease
MALSVRPRRPATYDDLLQVPGHLVAEIVGGELHTTPRPSPRHAAASSGLGGALHGPFDRGRGGPGGWYILDEPELHLGHDVLVPDLAGWRRERLPALPEEAYFSLAPDWICEVLSPATAALDRIKKLAVYARERVAYAWLIDPISFTVEVLQLKDGRRVIVSTCGGADVVSLPPFDAMPLDLTTLWELPDDRK